MHQLVYVSTATSPLDAEALSQLLTQARRNNEKRDLTGVLLFCDMGFFQVLEGPEPALRDVFGIIKNDGRHWKVSPLLDRWIERRSFPEWRMAASRVTAAAPEEGFLNLTPQAVGEMLSIDHDGVAQRLASAFLNVCCRGAA